MNNRSKSKRFSYQLEPLEQRKLLSAGLVVTYASSPSDVSGLATLNYNNTTIIDDSIQHEQFQVPRYYTLSNGIYTANGTGPSTHTWNSASHTLTYNYTWGKLTAQYAVPTGSDRLNIAFTVTNSPTSGVTLGGVVVYPAYVHFPGTITPTNQQQITGAINPATPLYAPEVAYGVDGPAVLPADYSGASTGSGVMVLANDGPATRQMYTALWSTNYNNAGEGVARPGQDYFIFAGTAPKDTMVADQAANPTTYTAPIQYTNTAPGQSDSFAISLRFGPAGTVPTALATDVETNYAAAYPQQVNWPDTRPIASLHLSSYGSATTNNPNAWTLGGFVNSSTVNVNTSSGLNSFSAGVMNYINFSMNQMNTDHSQGMIVWDLEGQHYPQPNPSYIGDPSQATTIAPEWLYNYQGNGPLIDQFFSAYSNAGYRVGVTLRPTAIQYVGGVPQQVPNNGVGSVPLADEITNLEAKIAYAYGRWGATLFYVDSNTGFDTAALRTVQQAYPNVLLIPEHQTISTFGTAIAYGELTNDFVGTPAYVRATYPTARSLIYIADGNMSNYASQLLSSLQNGDIMLFRAWFNDPNNAIMRSDYSAAMAVPIQVSLVASGSTGVIALSWPAQGNNAVYNIKRATSATGPFVRIASGAFGTGYSDATVTNYQTYYYTVTPVNGAGTGPESSVASATAAGPTVASPATALPSAVAGKSTNLSVSGSDVGGESTLTYTWSSVSTPANAPPVTFSANRTNLAKDTTVTFYQAGTYLLTAKITDPEGYSATSTVTVVVSQTVQSMFVLPPKVVLAQGGTQQYSVIARDQYSNLIVSPPVTWSVSGGGTIDANGLFTAGASGGTYSVTALSGSASANTVVTVQSTAPSVVAAGVVVSQAIDIGDSDFILHNGGLVGSGNVVAEVKAGIIFSSTADADASHLTTVGVMLNNNAIASPAGLYTSLDGLTTGLNDVLAKYTYYGDINLDGKVDASDYTRIDSGFLTHAGGWANGDLNYDGMVDGSDYTLIDNAFNNQRTSLGGGSHATSAARVSVPSTIFANQAISIEPQQSEISAVLDELKRRSYAMPPGNSPLAR